MSFYSPAPKRVEKRLPLAPRLDTLKGKTIAMYDNTKIAAGPALKTVEKFLLEQGVEKTFWVYTACCYRHPEKFIEEASKADAVVLSSAD